MIVRRILKSETEKAVLFSHDLIGKRENMTPNTPFDYNELSEHFNKILNHESDILLGCFKNGQIVGVLALMVVKDTNTLIAIGGPFIKSNFAKIFTKFNQFLKTNYGGFKVIYSFSTYNYKHLEYMRLMNKACYYNEYVFEIKKENADVKKGNLILLNKDYFELFEAYHDDTNKSWTTKEIIKNLNKINVYLKFNKSNKFIGYVVVDISKPKKEIIDILILNDYVYTGLDDELIESVLYYELDNKMEIKLAINDEYYIELFKNNNFIKIDEIKYFKMEM